MAGCKSGNVGAIGNFTIRQNQEPLLYQENRAYIPLDTLNSVLKQAGLKK